MAAATVHTGWRAFVGALGLLLLLGAPASAGTVLLLNGDQIQGEIVDVNTREVSIRLAGMTGSMSIDLREVEDIKLDSGESVYAARVQAALNRLDEEVRTARDDRRARLAGASEPATARAPEPEPEPEPEAAEPVRLAFGGQFESPLHGVRFRYPAQWTKKQRAQAYFTFADEEPDALNLWKFNLTVYETYEASFEDLREVSRSELESIKHYSVLRRRRTKVQRGTAERTTGLFEKDGAIVRHDQLIFKAKKGGVMVMNFFVTGGSAAPVPEVEAVIRSIETFK